MKNFVMSIKWKERLTNPYFYITVVATILAAAGINAEELTTWGHLWQSVLDVLSNPFTLGCVIIALIGDWYNPITKGLGD